MFNAITPDVIAVLIPIFFVAGGIVIAIVAIIASGRSRELEHKERLTAMEKGIPLPKPEPEVERKPVHSGRRAAGLLFLGIGLALTIALWAVEGTHGGVWGLIPLFMGAGLIIAAHFDKKEFEKQKEMESNE